MDGSQANLVENMERRGRQATHMCKLQGATLRIINNKLTQQHEARMLGLCAQRTLSCVRTGTCAGS